MKTQPLAFDAAAETRRITSFIRKQVSSAGARGAVLGVSGGVDSAVVGELCVRALGPKKVLAMLMPSVHTPAADLSDAESMVSRWGSGSLMVPIDPIVSAFLSASSMGGGRMANANLQARVRMSLLYLAANEKGLLVAGTGDRSEEEVGFFTKYGDGGVDFLPIAHLYKTQVRGLAAHLGLPRSVALKPASPQLWTGHTAAEELPVDYERLDLILRYMYAEGMSPARAASEAKVATGVVQKVRRMHERSSHKRSLPPSLV